MLQRTCPLGRFSCVVRTEHGHKCRNYIGDFTFSLQPEQKLAAGGEVHILPSLSLGDIKRDLNGVRYKLVTVKTDFK